MLYYSHANIPDISVRWTTDTVTDGADTQYSIEYPNPVLLSRVFSDVGGGVHTLSCFYRMSPVSLVGSIMLIIRGILHILIQMYTLIYILLSYQILLLSQSAMVGITIHLVTPITQCSLLLNRSVYQKEREMYCSVAT